MSSHLTTVGRDGMRGSRLGTAWKRGPGAALLPLAVPGSALRPGALVTEDAEHIRVSTSTWQMTPGPAL